MSEKKIWEVFSSETVFETPVFSVNMAETKCPRTEKISDFYSLNFPSWVNVLAVTPNERLIMIKQYRHGSKSFELEIPGGVVDSDDLSIIDAGKRELMEETGFAGEKSDIIGKVCPNPALQGNSCYSVYVENAEKVSEPQMESMEDIETVLFPLDEITDLVRSGKISHGIVLNALYFLNIYGIIRN